MAVINLTVDKKGRFRLEIPYIYHSYMDFIVERSWSKAKKQWIIPNTAQNREGLKALSKEARANGIETSSCEESREMLMQEIVIPSKIVDPNVIPLHRLQLKYEPLDYQLRAIVRGYPANDFALFHKPGLGKSMTAIAMGQIWEVNLHIIVPPNALIDSWYEQIEEHEKADVNIFDVNDLRKGRINVTGDCTYLLIGIESLQSGSGPTALTDFIYYNRDSTIQITIDESTTIKTFDSIRTRYMHDTGQSVDKRMLLNGTSITKGYEDLFGQFRFFGPDVIGYDSYYAFRNQYCIMGDFENKKIIGYKNTEELLDRLSPYVDIEEKTNKAPPKLDPAISKVELTKEQKKVYRDVQDGEYIDDMGTEFEIDEKIVELIRLQQVCGGFFPTDPDPDIKDVRWIGNPDKLPSIIELKRIINMYHEDEPIVIFCKYKPEARLIANAVNSIRKNETCAENHGDNPRANTEVQDFKNGVTNSIVGTYSKMAKGHNFQRSTLTIHYSLPFSYDQLEQSQDRTNRLNSTDAARYHIITRRNTIDDRIAEVLRQRKDVSDHVNEVFQIKQRGLEYAGQSKLPQSN